MNTDLVATKPLSTVVPEDPPTAKGHPQAHPGCDICHHPASMLFDEGVYLCPAHLAEARCLSQEAAHIEWSLTPEGLAALEASA